MGAVNRFPQGLLGLLQSQSTGRTPNDANENLQLTLDMLPFYLAGSTLKASRAIDTGNTLGAYSDIEVPAGETWLIVSVASQITALAGGDSVTAWPQIGGVPPIPESASPTIPVECPITGLQFSFNWSANVVGDRYTNAWSPPTPLIVRAPVKFNTFVSKVAPVGNISIETIAVFYQLDV